MAEDDDDGIEDLTHATPAYKRALWMVVLLNLAMGAAEAVGGFIGRSQALKADSLDFLGDGTITFLGLLAIGWGGTARARAALTQSLFLGALGLFVLANTAYRVLVLERPEVEIMGGFAVAALLVNVASALILFRHRGGDANVRAVWLFSRNDAFGNLAVLVAAGVVALTGSAWPDLIVAALIAGLFLQSAWEIYRGARRELRERS